MRMFKVLAITLLFSTFAAAQTGGTKDIKQVPSFDPTAMDKTADPCVDFYQYSCGGWRKNNPIPSDQAVWGRFNELAERNRAILRDILEEAAKPGSTRTANDKKTGDYYASCMDEAAINAKGNAALKPEFDRINALKSKADVPALIAHLHSEGIDALFGVGAEADFKNAKEVIAQAAQGGLSLPERDYYLRTDAKSVELQKGYVQHVTNMFKLLGDSPEKAAAEAQAIMNIETALAKGSLGVVDLRDPSKIYHKMSLQEWQALTPSMSWAKYLAAMDAPSLQSLNAATPDFFTPLPTETHTAPLDLLQPTTSSHVITL